MEVYYKSISCVFFFILSLPIIKIMICFILTGYFWGLYIVEYTGEVSICSSGSGVENSAATKEIWKY